MNQNINRPFLLNIRNIIKFIIKPVFHTFRKFTIIGKDNLPKKGPYILISNHATFIDSIYFICAVPFRFVICGAKPKYFTSFIKRTILGIANIIKVETKEQFINDCSKLLKNKEVILIYPEMGRNAEAMGMFKIWAAEVALKNGCPIIPCYLYGTTKDQDKKIKLIIGSSFLPEKTPELLTCDMRQKILSLKGSIG